MIQWEDKTTYSRDDNERIPQILEARINSIGICVHRHIRYPGKWLLTSKYLFIDKMELKSENIDDAKKEALSIVNKHLMYMQIEISNAIKQIKKELIY